MHRLEPCCMLCPLHTLFLLRVRRLLSVYKGSRTQLVELFAVQRSLVPASKVSGTQGTPVIGQHACAAHRLAS